MEPEQQAAAGPGPEGPQAGGGGGSPAQEQPEQPGAPHAAPAGMAEAAGAAGAAAEAAAAQAAPPAQAAAAEGGADGEHSGDEQKQERDGDGGPQGANSLLLVAQQRVLQRIQEAAYDLSAPFTMGGSLGQLPMVLAVMGAPRGPGSTGEAGAASSAATQPRSEAAAVLRFPEGGAAALQALTAACTPAKFGKGTEEGGLASSGDVSNLLCTPKTNPPSVLRSA